MLFRPLIDRDSHSYRRDHYRGSWQPLWAIIGLVSCTLLMLFSGWPAIYNLCAKSEQVPISDSIVDLVADYLGVGLSSGIPSQLEWRLTAVQFSQCCFLVRMSDISYSIKQKSDHTQILRRFGIRQMYRMSRERVQSLLSKAVIRS